MKEKIIFLIILFFILITLGGCTEKVENVFGPESKFVGTWILVEGPGTFSTIVLEGDNRAMLQPGSYSATWEINDGRLVFHLDLSPVYTPTYDYEFRDSDTLILALVGHDIPVTYIRN